MAPVTTQGNLRQMLADNPLPSIAPDIMPHALSADEATVLAAAALDELNAALTSKDVKAVEACFFPRQSYWKDNLALTYHLRTISTVARIANNLVETAELRQMELLRPEGIAQVNPNLKFIDYGLTFRTGSPAATASGKVLLLPVKIDGSVKWKIWVLSTRLEDLDTRPEDELLLRQPGRKLDGDLETEVFILGAGNAALALAARLKALGVESIMADRNPKIGDNWALRYDSLKFHVPTSFCDLPYKHKSSYDDELRNRLLARDDIAEQARQYVDEFHLNVLLSTTVSSATYDGRWTINVNTPTGKHIIVAQQLVQATGIASQKLYVPTVIDEGYKGVNIHSSQYQNPAALKAQGVSSMVVVGSANTGFDVLEDCYDAGICVNMLARSPTYIVPLDYITNPLSLGLYDAGVDAADRLILSLPLAIDGALNKGLFTALARAEPDRYKALAAAGFPVLDSAHKECALMHNLVERAGGHYVDTGATQLITDGKVGVKANVELVALTQTGLRFSDKSSLDADAVIWCTGFADTDARGVAAGVIGDLADQLEPTWGIDEEGEICGMWKRSGVERFWVMGGYTQQHRWHSRTLALQIKADLAGILPEAHRNKERQTVLSSNYVQYARVGEILFC